MTYLIERRIMVTSVLTAKQKAENGLFDSCGRRVDHLRVSVTSACGLRCVYCRPGRLRVPDAEPPGSLTDQQRTEFIGFLYERFGLRQVRITGGEPLLHPGLVTFIASLRRTLPDLSIAMTTNGAGLRHLADDLRRAGLDRLNVSLDSLDPGRYRRITGGSLSEVMAGLDAAVAAGFEPSKINVVVLRGINDREIIDLSRWSLSRGSEIRFLEAMPIGPAAETNRRCFLSANEIRSRLREHFTLTPMDRRSGETAQRYRANGEAGSGVVGLIAPMSEPFCGQCRRMRLTADGKLYPCLLDTRFTDTTSAWEQGTFRDDRAAELVCSAVAGKRPEGTQRQVAAMVTLGG